LTERKGVEKREGMAPITSATANTGGGKPDEKDLSKRGCKAQKREWKSAWLKGFFSKVRGGGLGDIPFLIRGGGKERHLWGGGRKGRRFREEGKLLQRMGSHKIVSLGS